MRIQPVVEGHGEVQALPVLLRRLRDASALHDLEVNRPIRRRRPELVNEQPLRRMVRLALLQEGSTGVLVVFDGDDAPACVLGPRAQAWASSEAGGVPCAVVIAVREYEAWFLGALESLRGKRGIRPDAVSHGSPEDVRRAKELLEGYMDADASYLPTTDQAALTASFDLASAYRRCRSFRRFVKAFGVVASGGRGLGPAWPPPDWRIES